MAISARTKNRPQKFGTDNQEEYIVQESEVTFRAQNDANGNPIYIGRARVSTLEGEERWQIQFITYDGNNSITSITWPENAVGIASSNYEFSWTDRATYTYS